MEKREWDQQSYADAFDRNLEGMRIEEIKEALGFMVEEDVAYPIEELAGKEVHLTPDQYGSLHAWDIFLEDVIPRMEQDKAKAHEIKDWEKRQFGNE